MKRYLYVSHRVREEPPSGPVLIAQVGRRLTYTNHVALVMGGKVVAELRFDERGLKDAPDHRVRAWVEVRPGVEIKTSSRPYLR